MAQYHNDNPSAYSDGVEKGTSLDDNTSTIQAPQRRRRLAENMPSARNILLTLAVCLLVTLGLASAVSSNGQSCHDVGANGCDEPEVEQDHSSFSRLLGSASPEALHRFLHAYFPKAYQHGVFDSEKSALEAVHSADPELASSIVQLARRQNGNETTTAETSVTTTTTDPGDATTTETTVTPEPSTTDSAPTTDATTTTEASTETPTPDETPTPGETSTTETSTAVETSIATEISTTTETPTSIEVTEVTTTTQQTSTETATETETDDAPATTTETETETTATEPASDPTTGQIVATGTTLETSKAPPTPSTRTSTFTSTLPGGAQTTVTSVEVITAGLPDEEEPTEAPTGALQSGLAVPLSHRHAMEALVGAVIGGALLA
ncbi:hypothetical protein DL769_006290 [Monosporascus sp. CRB-8-3]|nr:hypothetical protein DL769_006290 [Monosporascus sp. CRB-8-3]